MNYNLLLDNLTNPALLFFVLGIVAVYLKSDLEIPDNSSKFISLYLLFAIGFKGGQELSHEAITAEIGLMKATEQLSAMEMMAVSPIARIIGPRFWAGVISMPILASIFSMVGVMGGYLVAVPIIGVDHGAFWSQMNVNVDFRFDVINGLIKSFVFGVACTIIALYEGYDAPPTAEGVSRATTRTVVTSSLTVLGLDFILTSFMMSN